MNNYASLKDIKSKFNKSGIVFHVEKYGSI